MSVKVFFCYAHEDEALLNKLKSHLRPLQREGLIDVWYDRDISAGSEWEKEISEHLNASQIILLLISPDFMDSDYCYGAEMKRAMERLEQEKAHVIPIILRLVYWHLDPLNKLQALPRDGKPVTDQDWHSMDVAFLDVTMGIRKIILDTFYNKYHNIKSQLIFEGNIHAHAGRFAEALRCYEEAINLNPFDGDSYFRKYFVLMRLGRTAEAKEALRQSFIHDYFQVRRVCQVVCVNTFPRTSLSSLSSQQVHALHQFPFL